MPFIRPCGFTHLLEGVEPRSPQVNSRGAVRSCVRSWPGAAVSVHDFGKFSFKLTLKPPAAAPATGEARPGDNFVVNSVVIFSSDTTQTGNGPAEFQAVVKEERWSSALSDATKE